MSRTRRREPSSGCWLRRPHGKTRAIREGERADYEYAEDGVVHHKMRKTIPPDAWDDLVVSDRRGQAWAREAKERWR